MIRPPGRLGIAFTESHDGDMRHDPVARHRMCLELGIPDEWAIPTQVHGNRVRRVSAPGESGEGDAIWTDRPGLPVAVLTADCFGVALIGEGAVGVAHAGWRGAAQGVVRALRSEMESAGHVPVAAAVSPGIGPCCLEVGEEVAAAHRGHVALTGWGTRSVDLVSRLGDDLDGIDTWWSGRCTMHQPGSYSHRLNRTVRRMASIAWRT